ncbi:MAG: hypothetical protein DMF61_17205 [Blastocatellia bacterium AA13]|nr:MAG: hypothetical protein DMF61_17205 [Blastocatellia bacterium AA13]
MVKTILVDQDVEEGRRLLNILSGTSAVPETLWGKERVAVLPAVRFKVEAAFWWYLTESSEWRLVIATRLVDEIGPLRTYAEIQTILSAIKPPLTLTVQNISVVSPKDERVKVLRKTVRVKGSSTGMRFAHNTIDHVYVDDSFIYRVH